MRELMRKPGSDTEEEFDIEPGSLVYGTNETRRAKVIDNPKIKKPDYGVPFADLINEETRYRPYLVPYPKPCHPRGHVFQLLEEEQDQKLIDLDKQDTLARLVYIHHFAAKRFEAPEDRENRDKLEDYISSMTTKDKDHEKEEKSQHYNSFINKRCKIGILTTLQNGNAIHVLVDILDAQGKPIPNSFLNFFNKDHFKYSSSEMRFIYRNWNDLEYYFRNGQFKFWTVATDCELGLRSLKEAPWENASVKDEIDKVYKPSRKKDVLYGRFWMEDRIRREVSAAVPVLNKHQYAFREMPSVLVAQYAVEYATGFEAEPKEVKHHYVSKIQRKIMNAGFGLFSQEAPKERKFEVLDEVINSRQVFAEGKEICTDFRAGKFDGFVLLDKFATLNLRHEFYYLVEAMKKDANFCREILANKDILTFCIEKFPDSESNLMEAYNQAYPSKAPGKD